MTGPIKPGDIASAKTKIIPEKVFEVFNKLIARQWNGFQSRVKQDHVVQELLDAGFSKNQLFDEHMIDVEDSYRAAGWDVKYDKPAYNETYPATFTFTKRK